MPSPVISIDRLSFSYERTPILKEVSFQVYPNEFIGIIGPNGGGKTTLLKLILGFLTPSHGSLTVFGHPPVTSSTNERLAYVPQTTRFDRDFPISVEEVVLSGILSELPWYGKFQTKHRQAAREALLKVGLPDLSHRSFGSLSGGQAQRVLIARALIAKPQLLLLDEPTSSVDQQAENEIYGILKQLKGQITILMVTHDFRTAMEHVERLLCVQRKVFELKPKEVCDHFALGLYHL